MARLPLCCVLWVCLLTAVHPELPTECREKHYPVDSRCCPLCQPGQKLVNDCTETTDTVCQPCDKDEFQATWNRERHCHQHTYCDPKLKLHVQREGTSETDTICICEEGWHCTSKACENCAPHRSCAPGFGVKQMATGISDTICETCPVGFFSNVSSVFEKCRPWTSCEAKDLMEIQAGTNKTDALCGSRDRIRALVVIPIVTGILLAVLLVFVSIRKVLKKPKNKALHPMALWQDPQETNDFPDHNPAAPVQETLHGCQPVTQEDGKESRISVQERQ
ncbi:tumor necrosis factor receptor superfamily member 5 isoform X2 [Carlito syrichta]|uniref:Tumor necrosis factor receptor superfamily member 5 n=1 Tax=Carlito syrichta TaxID=1868482 RepID=A0A1U7TSP8_CARSF|nr:tumor necrosis factor receptor superfamily member 5 isoform X2 [Carlito syrichta]